MQATLTDLLVRCVEEGRGEGGGGTIDPRKYPQQILCLAEQVLFTERCEAAIVEDKLAELLIELESQLDSYTSADISVSWLAGCVCTCTAFLFLRQMPYLCTF